MVAAKTINLRFAIPLVAALTTVGGTVAAAETQTVRPTSAPVVLAQAASPIPAPRISPSRAVPNEGGPSQADLPPGSKNAVAGDDTRPPAALSPFDDGLRGDDFDTATPYDGL